MDTKTIMMESLPYHNMIMKDRKHLEVSGIKKIDRFDEEEFLLESIQGHIEIKGNSLTLDKLDKDRGEVVIKGTIHSIIYSSTSNSDKQSMFTKLFK